MRRVSVPVTLADLPDEIARFGNTPYLLTVGADAAPRATSVRVRWHGRRLATGAGTRTAANIRENATIVLLWPAPEPGGHALIVDGLAEVLGSDVYIQPARAVLHVTRH